jgi:hypothetical protein
MSLELLEKNALWIIMDPWEKTPDSPDLERYPNLDLLNHAVVKQIAEYLPKLNRVLVSCPIANNIKIHPRLTHVNNLNHNFELLQQYIIRNDIKDIVYAGFHHGDCIINRPTGAANVQRHCDVNLWLKRSLVGVLPWEDEASCDTESKKYMRFV